MTAAASITVNGRISGTPAGQDGPINITVGPLAITSADASGEVLQTVLGAGANTINVPQLPAASGCIIMLHNDNTQAVTLKGVTGDTGVSLGKTGTTVLNWDAASPPASFCLTSAGAQTGLATTIIFF